MSRHSRDVFRDEYDFSQGEIGRHHEAYRRRERGAEALTRDDREDVADPDQHARGGASGKSVKKRD